MTNAIPRWLRLCVPTSLTLVNLACGVVGVGLGVHWLVAGSTPDTLASLLPLALLLAALIADGLDGAAARRLEVATRFGRRLDQLADAVTSGLMPAVMLAALARPYATVLGLTIAAVFLASGVTRLTAQSDRIGRVGTRFVGMPLPVAAAIVVGHLPYLASRATHANSIGEVLPLLWAVCGVVMLCCVLMLSRLRYPSPSLLYRWLRRRRGAQLFLLLVGVPVLVMGLPTLIGLTWLLFFYAYAGQPIRRHVRRWTPAWLKLDLTPARSPSSASRSAR
ncbi:MAG: CDP-alcohol phosphatidyltransferase family protein [Planctomycetota bacterium]